MWMLHLTSKFKNGNYASDLSSAKTIIADFLKKQKLLPDIIIVDILFNKTEFTNFIDFIQDKKLNQILSIVYNENKLCINEINFLKYNQLVDDVI